MVSVWSHNIQFLFCAKKTINRVKTLKVIEAMFSELSRITAETISLFSAIFDSTSTIGYIENVIFFDDIYPGWNAGKQQK
jgi:hypothetical protein